MKTDILDCQWIQQLHSYGFLIGVFRPGEDIVKFRALAKDKEDSCIRTGKLVKEDSKKESNSFCNDMMLTLYFVWKRLFFLFLHGNIFIWVKIFVMKCKDVINFYPPAVKEKLVSIFCSPDFKGIITSDDIEELIKLFGISEEQLMQELVNIAKQYAISSISNFQVGAIVRGDSGSFYLGANQEFPGETLTFTLHAEQAAIANAITHDEKGIIAVASTYVPCCLCRQFMYELDGVEKLKIILPDKIYSLLDIVPHPFGPSDLGLSIRLMQKRDNGLLKNEINYSNDRLVLEALFAANKSYSPYSKSYSGVALLTKDERIFTGRYAENAAFNISMNPMMAALSNLNMSNLNFKDISRAVIVEPRNNIVSQIKSAGNLLFTVNPDVDLETVKAD